MFKSKVRYVSGRVPRIRLNHLDGKSHLRPLHGAQAAGSTTAPRCGRRGEAAWPACRVVAHRKVRLLALSVFPPPPPNPTQCGVLTHNATGPGKSLIRPVGRTGKCPDGRKLPCCGLHLNPSHRDRPGPGPTTSASGVVLNHHRAFPSESNCLRRRCGAANSSGKRYGH